MLILSLGSEVASLLAPAACLRTLECLLQNADPTPAHARVSARAARTILGSARASPTTLFG